MRSSLHRKTEEVSKGTQIRRTMRKNFYLEIADQIGFVCTDSRVFVPIEHFHSKVLLNTTKLLHKHTPGWLNRFSFGSAAFDIAESAELGR